MAEWLRKLQEGDERTKWRAAVGLTIVSMTVIIIVWLFYFNTLVTSGTPTAEDTINKGEFSFWGSMKNETALIFGNFKDAFGDITKKLNSPKEYEIQPNN